MCTSKTIGKTIRKSLPFAILKHMYVFPSSVNIVNKEDNRLKEKVLIYFFITQKDKLLNKNFLLREKIETYLYLFLLQANFETYLYFEKLTMFHINLIFENCLF